MRSVGVCLLQAAVAALSLAAAGCVASFSSSFSSSSAKTCHLIVLNSSGHAVLVNCSGFLFPSLESGEESEDLVIHVFETPGTYVAFFSPLDEFDPLETMHPTALSSGESYRLTVSDITLDGSTADVSYTLELRW